MKILCVIWFIFLWALIVLSGFSCLFEMAIFEGSRKSFKTTPISLLAPSIVAYWYFWYYPTESKNGRATGDKICHLVDGNISDWYLDLYHTKFTSMSVTTRESSLFFSTKIRSMNLNYILSLSRVKYYNYKTVCIVVLSKIRWLWMIDGGIIPDVNMEDMWLVQINIIQR